MDGTSVHLQCFNPPLQPGESELRRKVIGAYTAFVPALFLTVVNTDSLRHRSWLVAILALSSPSLTARVLFDELVFFHRRRLKSFWRDAAAGTGLATSMVGFVILVWSFSRVAAAVFPILAVFWWVLFMGEVSSGGGVAARQQRCCRIVPSSRSVRRKGGRLQQQHRRARPGRLRPRPEFARRRGARGRPHVPQRMLRRPQAAP